MDGEARRPLHVVLHLEGPRLQLGREDAEDEHRRALRLPSWWLPHSLPRASVGAAYFLDKDSRFEMKGRAPQGDPTEITRFHTALQRKLELQSSLPTRDLLTEIPKSRVAQIYCASIEPTRRARVAADHGRTRRASSQSRPLFHCGGQRGRPATVCDAEDLQAPGNDVASKRSPPRWSHVPHGGPATPGETQRLALRISSRRQHRPSTSNRACSTRFDGVTNVPLSLAYDLTSHAIVRREQERCHHYRRPQRAQKRVWRPYPSTTRFSQASTRV